MIKGVGKKIIMLNNTDSEMFEQAIFILRPEGKTPYKNIVKECERMMNCHLSPNRDRNSKNGWRIAFFALLTITVSLALLYFIK